MNSDKLTLLDVFSYSCMNCLRSLKFIKKIDRKYRKFGLKTVIIHPHEWQFEKNKRNVKFAIKKYKIRLPIRIDKYHKIIRKFGIDFWPAQILVKGKKIVYKHVGEGNYKALEGKIRGVLKTNTKNVYNKEPEYTKYPTIYLGKNKHGRIMSMQKNLKFGCVYKSGKWLQKGECMESKENGCSLALAAKGTLINFVAMPANRKPARVDVMLNKRFIKKIVIDKPCLYSIAGLKNKKKQELCIVTGANLSVYSFSFQ